jgi:hypothetical protein
MTINSPQENLRETCSLPVSQMTRFLLKITCIAYLLDIPT